MRIGSDAPCHVRARQLGPDQILLTPRNGAPRRFTLIAEADLSVVTHLGTRWRFEVRSEVQALARVAAQAGTQGSEIKSEMPGVITAIHVAAGDAVVEGQVLVVMEAMKLIFPLVAPRSGTVAALRCALGEVVSRGQTLLQLEPLVLAE